MHAAIQALEQQNASLRALLGSVPTGEPTDAAALARVTEELEAVKVVPCNHAPLLCSAASVPVHECHGNVWKLRVACF